MDPGSSSTPQAPQVPGDLSILPLDTTSQSLSILPLEATAMQSMNLSNLPQDTTGVSVGAEAEGGVSLNQSFLSSIDPNSLQINLARFHDIVCTLVRNYTTASAQVSTFGSSPRDDVYLSHHRLSFKVSFLAVSHSQLAVYEQKFADFQASLSLAHSQGVGIREKEAELQHTKKKLEQRDMELAEALVKIRVRLIPLCMNMRF